MPYKEFKIEKMYYSIGEVAELFGESVSLIRFWAKQFSEFVKPDRNQKGDRRFSKEDIDNFKIIYHLVKDRGMTLDGAVQRMRDNKFGLDRKIEVIQSLEGIKNRLTEIYKSM